MTIKRLSSITGLSIEMVQSGDSIGLLARDDAGKIVLKTSPHKKLQPALKELELANWRRVSEIVIKRQGMKCAYCGRVGPLQIHHVVPRSKGRKDTPENLIAICGAFGCRAHLRIHGQCS